MGKRGFITIIGLWLAAAGMAVAATALHAARIEASRATRRLHETHALHAAVVAATLYHTQNFQAPTFEKSIDGLQVIGARRTNRDGSDLVTTFDIFSGRFRKTYDLGWKRIGAEWRPSWWSER